MPRQSSIAVENNFIKGLITEVSPLQYPENATTDTDNCVYSLTGKVSRRLGFGLEEEAVATAMTVDNNAKNTFVWKNVAEEGDLTFVVVQNGNTLHFYQVSADAALSGNKHASTIDLTSFIPVGGSSSTTSLYECQFANANGALLVTHPKLNTILVEYSISGNTIAGTAVTLYTRDFEGDRADTLYDPSTFSSRPTSTLGALAAAHRYNLENQGWTSTTLTSWDTARTDMPSNSDVSWYFKSATDVFDFTTVADRVVGNSKAPNGHFLYNLYAYTRTGNVSGSTDYAISLDRVSTCAFFAGRAWYGGLNYQGQNSKLFFSQILEHKSQFGYCYQVNDPTAEEKFDLLPSDGGVIDLLEAGKVLKMIPILNTLFVFCTNGVWAISGSSGIGFAANDYSITKISDIPNSSHCSFVRAEDTVYWWSQLGVYTITKDKQSNALAVQSVSNTTIQEFFYDIPLEAREFARGVYDSLNKRVQWVFRSTTAQSFSEKYIFDRVLNLNLLTGAFYPWTIDVSTNRIHGIISAIGAGGAQVMNDVVSASGVNNVQSASGTNEVVVFQSENSSVDSVTKYFVSYDSSGIKTSFAEEYLDTYQDWGATYDSYFVTGYRLRGQAIRKFQSNYVRLFTDNDEPSIFKIRGIWDFALDGTRGRFSEVQGIDQLITISDDTSYAIKSKRVKVRGHGLCLQLMFSSSEDEPFDIIGWSIWETGNAAA